MKKSQFKAWKSVRSKRSYLAAFCLFWTMLLAFGCERPDTTNDPLSVSQNEGALQQESAQEKETQTDERQTGKTGGTDKEPDKQSAEVNSEKSATKAATVAPTTGDNLSALQDQVEDIRFVVEGDADGIVKTEQIWQKIFEQVGVELKEPLRKRRLVESIDLNRPRARWLVRGLDFALRPAVRLSLNAEKTGIVVELNQAEIEEIKNSFGQTIREASATTKEWNSEPYGLNIVHPNSKATRTVVIVHGFNSSPEPFDHVIELIQTIDVQIATFYYPSQLGVKSAAERLSNEIKAFANDNAEQSITILTHSMGGLCSRYLVENEELDCLAVDRLVLVAPPNHGTEIAQPGLTGEVFDGVVAQIDRPKIADTLKSIVTEINYGLKDLEPNSELIAHLESFTRNPRVSYHILLGDKAPLTREQVAMASNVLERIKMDRPVVNLAKQQMADTLQQLSKEIAKPDGDGVVSVSSGKLEGVEDVEIINFSHNDMIVSESEGWEILKDEILERLNLDLRE